MTLPSLNGVPNVSPTAIERRDHVGGELAGLLQHGIDRVLVDLAVEALGEGLFQAGGVFEGESDVGDGGAVGHGANLAAGRVRSKRRAAPAGALSIYREWRRSGEWTGRAAVIDRAGPRRYGPPAAPPLGPAAFPCRVGA